uniref:Uncharacterized protein n=1 Tax=Anguilla anguilla TaxID=7936 RepID=A0A0E9VA94_ANGAN
MFHNVRQKYFRTVQNKISG